MIKKRNGRKEVLDITKIQKMTIDATADLDSISQCVFELDAQIKFIDGMSSSDIQDALIKSAIEKIDIDVTNWTFVVTRLFVFDLYHRFGKTIYDMSSIDIKNSFLEFVHKISKEEKQKNKEKQYKLHKQIIKNLGQIKLIKSQLINQIIYIYNNSYFNIFLFNIIGNNSSEKPNN
jgi:hypothetical protein